MSTARTSEIETMGTRGGRRRTGELLLEVDNLHVEFRTRDGVAGASTACPSRLVGRTPILGESNPASR